MDIRWIAWGIAALLVASASTANHTHPAHEHENARQETFNSPRSTADLAANPDGFQDPQKSLKSF